MAKKKPKFNIDELKQSVHTFAAANSQYKRMSARLAELKEDFYSVMEEYFQSEGLVDTGATFEYAGYQEFTGTLRVNRVQKSSVEFDADKLTSALGKEYAKDVVSKRYEIQDMAGLITYLKECDVDPKIFKSFIQVTKTANTQELENLEATGKITAEQISGCYTVKTHKPYFVVKTEKGQGGED